MPKTAFVVLGILLSSPVLAAPLRDLAKAPAGKSAEKRLPPKDAEKVLSDAWYTVTVNGKLHYGYYNDRVSLRQGRLFFQNRYWKKEEDFINEEQLGAYAEDTAELAPLFFNFHSTYRASELMVDGSVDKKRMTIKVRKGSDELPVVKRDIPSKAFLEVFFPVWVNRNEAQLAAGKSLPYLAIFEDSVEDGFSAVPGRVKMEKADEIAQKTDSRKYSVELKGMKSVWYFDKQGVPARIEMPEQHAVVERVTAERAQNFLSE